MRLRNSFVVSLGFLWPAAAACPAAELDRAIAEITRHGGRVKTDEKMPGKPVVAVTLSYCTVNDDLLAVLTIFPELHTVDLGAAKFNEKSLARLKDCPKLRTLYLNLTRISDDGLAHLSDLAELREINLFKTQVDNAGLAHLKGLPHLEALNVVQTKVTDDGVRELQKALPNLKETR